jgi:hypothetical protein
MNLGTLQPASELHVAPTRQIPPGAGISAEAARPATSGNGFRA